ncbi:MAG: CCA tRNA nucleotidyltransferase [Lachnospiraceae bacterium]|nr:CCA tRNA nucleotidyltransferase [Lachnospiraceae bacterium]MBQ9233922.1 CCA tRNA nucleotidyltransferase [Lachnospiraceae bacterium]
MDLKIKMPKGAAYIIDELNKNGFEAYIVGGCVRDSLLGKRPHDWDITTSANPYQVKDIFKKTVDTGLQHGTVTVLVDKAHSLDGEYAFEVTTYRVDGIYEDHRRPKKVTFSKSLEEDLKRRDFTINAMAYNDSEGVVDIFGGKDDLKSKIVRCVGVPSDRFDEDALRILRAVRFAAQLGFDIDEPTKEAMKKQARFLSDISAERIREELTKLITSDNPGMLVMAYELGLTGIFLPEFDTMMETPQHNPNHLYSVGIHTIKVMENVPKNVVLRYAALLHDVAKPACRTTDENGVDHFYEHHVVGSKMAQEILKRLKFDNETIDRVVRLVLYHDYGIGGEIGVKSVRRFLAKLGKENFEDFITIREADRLAQSDYNQSYKVENTSRLKSIYEMVVRENQCLKISDLAIGGNDLMELGMKPGKAMGDMLKYLLDAVLDEPGFNSRDKLLELAKKKIYE